MMVRLLYEGAVGFVLLIAILLWGSQGMIALALLAFMPILWRILKAKPDERELQLFYQTNNWALAFAVIVMVAIYEFPDVAPFGHAIGEYWMPLCLGAILLGRGAIGVLLFQTR
ncbi:MAG: hypothetical protein D6681_15870 [Calditrichaeota bacterium]|nr:MAG: hypothetical protein D6681_15870 [Calditrichota bacterium]